MELLHFANESFTILSFFGLIVDEQRDVFIMVEQINSPRLI